MRRPRGAKPSPRHRLASASPHRIVGPTPAQWLWLPSRLSYWLNNLDGDCVTAEEAFKCACSDPEIFIADGTVLEWAYANGTLDGTELTTVLDLMQNAGFLQQGMRYNSGRPSSVDWTNTIALQNAIAQGPVKIGVAADQLENVVPNPPTNGWIATGFQQDSNEDHCVSLCGYGEIGWLANQLGVGSPVPRDTPAYALYTWKSIGIIDVPSMLAITGEAWLRSPNTIAVKN